jgi:hypothetical protein
MGLLRAIINLFLYQSILHLNPDGMQNMYNKRREVFNMYV